MFKFVILVASIAYVSGGIIPAEHHELHHHGLTFPSAHGTILEHSHLAHAPIAKIASHHDSIYSHPHYAVAAGPTIVKVTSPVIKYVSQPIVKVAYPHYPHSIPNVHHHELHEHLPKVTYKLATPLISANHQHHHHHQGHALTLPTAIHTSPIVLSAAPAYHHQHHATLPLASHHHGHHEILH